MAETPSHGPRRGGVPSYTDATAAVPAKVKRREKDTTEIYWCPRCDKRQCESILARSRRPRVKCRHCGTVIGLLRTPKKAKREKVCRKCKKRLRDTVRMRYCDPCFETLPLRRREILLGVRDRHGRITLWK